MSKNQVIGKNNRLPWSLPADLAYFKNLTMGHPVIMGRKTFESLGRPLQGRENIIVTTNAQYQQPGCKIFHSLDESLAFSSGKQVFVIGGAQVYRQFMPHADRLYITLVNQIIAGDSFFPDINPAGWRLLSQTKGEKSAENPYDFSFLIYDKVVFPTAAID